MKQYFSDRIEGTSFRVGWLCHKAGKCFNESNFQRNIGWGTWHLDTFAHFSLTNFSFSLKVEYRPCVIPSNCWDLIREFMQGFMGSHVTNTIPPYFTVPSMMAPNQTKQNDIYQPIDTVQQYLEHFSNYRKLNNPPPVMGMRN